MSKLRSSGCLNSDSTSITLADPSSFRPVTYSISTVWPIILEKMVDIVPPSTIAAKMKTRNAELTFPTDSSLSAWSRLLSLSRVTALKDICCLVDLKVFSGDYSKSWDNWILWSLEEDVEKLEEMLSMLSGFRSFLLVRLIIFSLLLIISVELKFNLEFEQSHQSIRCHNH